MARFRLRVGGESALSIWICTERVPSPLAGSGSCWLQTVFHSQKKKDYEGLFLIFSIRSPCKVANTIFFYDYRSELQRKERNGVAQIRILIQLPFPNRTQLCLLQLQEHPRECRGVNTPPALRSYNWNLTGAELEKPSVCKSGPAHARRSIKAVSAGDGLMRPTTFTHISCSLISKKEEEIGEEEV